jgi:hypothetical protein
MLNMASMTRTQGVHEKKVKRAKHKYKTNKTQVLTKTKDFLVDIFYFRALRKNIQQLLRILEKRLDIVREERSFPRPKTASRRRHKILNSKGI